MARLTHLQVLEVDKLLESYLDPQKITVLRRDPLAKEMSRRLKYPISPNSIDALLKNKDGTYLNAKRRGEKHDKPIAVLARAVQYLFEKAGEPIHEELARLIDGEEREPDLEPAGAVNGDGTIFNS